MPNVGWKEVVESTSVTQTFINRLVWDNGYTQVVGKPTRGDSLLDIHVVRPDCELISCETVQEISDHCWVLLEVEWGSHCCETQEKRLLPVYRKTNVLGLQTFLRDKLPTWANNDSCVEDIWKNFKNVIFEITKCFVPHKSLKPNPYPEHYNKVVRRLKVKVRRAHNKRKLGDHYQAELRRLSKKLLVAKREAQKTFLSSILHDEGKSCSEVYKFVNSRKGNRGDIPSIKDRNGGHATDPVEKAYIFNNYYASIFSYERVIPDLITAHSDKLFTINNSIIRKRLAIIGRKNVSRTRQHPRRLTANGW